MTTLVLGDITAELTRKKIKNIHLSVYPPDGQVKISAPESMKVEIIRAFVISRIPWIRKQRQKFLSQEREAPREFIDRESHYFQGKRYLLRVVESNSKSLVSIKGKEIVLQVRSGQDKEKRRELLHQWYRRELKKQIPLIIEKYEPILNVKVQEFGVKKMKTRWGTCNITVGRIWLNLELAKKPQECLEYVIVHEMVHLLESSHNKRFQHYMDMYMPKWRYYRDLLNKLPVSHEDWGV